METVSVRELRNHGGEVLDRVARGETVVVTKDGVQIAILHPLEKRSPRPAELVSRRRSLPLVDPDSWRRDVDAVLDASL
jgi:prevent-host-death family protein